MMPFVRLENVTRRYDEQVTALGDVSLEIAAGEWVAVMGPSGSGKSTLLNILGGLDRVDAGRFLVDGLDLTRCTRQQLNRYRREQVGIIFQQFHLIPYLNALENVMLAQYLHSLADEDEARAALREMGLGDRLRHLPSELSGGERQRVCIARALINQPKLLLADEPTGNLDEENASNVMEIFQRMHSRGQTIVMVTHDLMIGRMAERQIQLEHGRLAGYYLSPSQESEDMDEVLEYLWLVKEGHHIPADVCARGALLARTGLVDQMRRKNLLAEDGTPGPAASGASTDARATPATSGGPREPSGLRFTTEGARRAELLIRRHRLAEKLFTETFQMEDAKVEEEACYFEHILSTDMTESICAFLGHPKSCPHGHTIPAGTCCTRR
jgi:putative ABC transport system ATP-binding protein